MKKYLITFLLALVIGFFLSNFFIKQYDNYTGIKVNSYGDELYFIQYGVYSSIESMERETIALENYVYNMTEDKYYVYVGITAKEEIANKIINYYKSLGYETIIKKYNISNKSFLEELKEYDSIIASTEDITVLSSLISQVLMKYEEVVINGKNKGNTTK